MAFGQYEVTFSFGLSDSVDFPFPRSLFPKRFQFHQHNEITPRSGFIFFFSNSFSFVDWKWWLLRALHLRLNGGNFRMCVRLQLNGCWYALKAKTKRKINYCNIFVWKIFNYLCIWICFPFNASWKFSIFMWMPIRGNRPFLCLFTFILFHLNAFNAMMWCNGTMVRGTRFIRSLSLFQNIFTMLKRRRKHKAF